ncbi:MAG: murein transglycosylase A [Sphingomonadaceae bacterium]|nr:murein transglycosylase A [Sphingomonadaceae bacterium]
MPITSERARAALVAFRSSCRALVRRNDRSGLTRGSDWRPACDAAAGWTEDDARGFFDRYFETVQIGEGRLFATGYYEPEITAVRTPPALGYGALATPTIPPVILADVDLGLFAADLAGRQISGRVQNGKLVPYAGSYVPPPASPPATEPATPPPGYPVPIYRLPGDLVEADLGLFAPDLKGRSIKGRVQDGRLIPYFDRGEIEDGALKGKGLEIAWATDPIELFFLQIQGSGRLIAPDGSVMRIGYAGQNGRAYVAIGKLLKDRGLLPPGQTTMQSVIDWLRAQPDGGDSVMRENKSFVFFKEITGPGPLGALGAPVVGRVSLAADPAFTPLGAPVWISSDDHPEATGLWVAQDTGGAIKGANRFDTFWGDGARARTIAGGMSAHGLDYLLLPVGTIERLSHDGAIARP